MPGLTVKTILCNLAKDIHLDWKGPPPSWWPSMVPFQSPWKPVDSRACIVKGQRDAVKALYESYGLDANKYVSEDGSPPLPTPTSTPTTPPGYMYSPPIINIRLRPRKPVMTSTPLEQNSGSPSQSLPTPTSTPTTPPGYSPPVIRLRPRKPVMTSTPLRPRKPVRWPEDDN